MEYVRIHKCRIQILIPFNTKYWKHLLDNDSVFPMNFIREYIILAAVSFTIAYLLSLLLMPVLIKLSKNLKWLDNPDHRKIHIEPVSRLGGIGIFVSLVVSFLVSPFFVSLLLKTKITLFEIIHPNLMLIVSFILIFTVGVLDDFVALRSKLKLLGQLLVASGVYFSGVGIYNISIPFTDISYSLSWWASLAVTFIWVIGIINAVNLIDGMDGLAATISYTAFSIYAVVFAFNGHSGLSLLCITVSGAILGYLFFNFPPAKLFMGDSGSMMLGFLLAVFPLMAEPESGNSLIMPVTLLMIPIMDVFFAIARRIRKKVPFSTPDMEHTHHKLLKLGLDERIILALVNTLILVSAVPVLIFYILSDKAFLPVIIVWIITGIFFVVLHFVYHKKVVN